jgi:hypothetical protein
VNNWQTSTYKATQPIDGIMHIAEAENGQRNYGNVVGSRERLRSLGQGTADLHSLLRQYNGDRKNNVPITPSADTGGWKFTGPLEARQ